MSDLVPLGQVRTREGEELKDQAARRWGGVAILMTALIISGIVIFNSAEASRAADRAWNLLFLIVGYAGAYIFRETSRRGSRD
ncbi:MAG TPA: hypothetical protein VMS43_02895 [Allosphingosinicella sp.]|nr:hypothetical protein [Allosphingosinicella sp.]